MKPAQAFKDRMTGGATGLRPALLALGIGVAACHGAQAQSAYDCRNLETHTALPAVEGAQGTFFALTPDLQAHQAMGAVTVTGLQRLSNALSLRGTTLVLLPVPGRAQVMAGRLPAMARHLGYDADVAEAVHARTIADLRAAGVQVADTRGALRRLALSGGAPFFGTDARPTPQGAQAMAQVVAEVLREAPQTKDLARATFRTTQGPEFTLESAMRARLQLACKETLPRPTAPSFETAGALVTATPGVAAVLGSAITATAELNLGGFISEASGLRAGAYGVADAGPFAAISSYLTSADFRLTPPQVIVWEFPMAQNLARFGDQPMEELIAAAGPACTQALPVQAGDATNKLVANLGAVQDDKRYTLALDTGGAPVDEVRFHMTSADGQTRVRSIYRHPDQILTGRFFLPLSGFETTGLREVMIEAPAAFGLGASVSLCPQEAL